MNYYKIPDFLKNSTRSEFHGDSEKLSSSSSKHINPSPLGLRSHTLNYIRLNKSKWKALASLRNTFNFIENFLPVCIFVLAIVIYRCVISCYNCNLNLHTEILLLVLCAGLILSLKIIQIFF